MAKAFYICLRNKAFNSEANSLLKRVCQKLTPDNLDPTSVLHKVGVTSKSAYAVMNYSGAVQTSSRACALGTVYDASSWYKPRSGSPDGSFAIFREDDAFFEAVSDPSGSRSIWYYFDEEILIASTSQRAITMLLGNFQFNNSVIPWVFSTGSLGPGLAWDSRVKKLDPDATLSLQKSAWAISIDRTPVSFTTDLRPEEEHYENLKEVIEHSIKKLTQNIDFANWVLPLSGGFDSRAILCFLNNFPETKGKLKTVTWGGSRSQDEKGSDEQIAKDVADTLGVENTYFRIDQKQDSTEQVMDRFILCGEGLIDHVSAYLDGFATWKTLFENGTKGIIRGDEGFGWTAALSEETVKHSLGICTCDDYANLKVLAKKFNFEKQVLPKELQIQTDETLPQWRDRMYHAYRMPTALAALSDLKYSYVEQANPLLSRQILQYVRKLPDHLRTEKSLFKKVANSVSPSIPYAKVSTSASLASIFGNPAVSQYVERTLRSPEGNTALGEDLCTEICSGIKPLEKNKSLKARMFSTIRSVLPDRALSDLKNVFRKNFTQNVNGNMLAFRAFMVVKMHSQLQQDALFSALSQSCDDADNDLQSADNRAYLRPQSDVLTKIDHLDTKIAPGELRTTS